MTAGRRASFRSAAPRHLRIEGDASTRAISGGRESEVPVRTRTDLGQDKRPYKNRTQASGISTPPPRHPARRGHTGHRSLPNPQAAAKADTLSPPGRALALQPVDPQTKWARIGLARSLTGRSSPLCPGRTHDRAPTSPAPAAAHCGAWTRSSQMRGTPRSRRRGCRTVANSPGNRSRWPARW